MVSFLYLHLDIYHFPRLLVDFLSCNIYNNIMMWQILPLSILALIVWR